MQVDEIVSFLEDAPIRVAVFGEFSAGKTTLLNALIGEDILSVAVDPTTAVPTRIRYGREFNVFVDLFDGERHRLFEDDPPFWTRFVGRGSVLNTLKKEQGQIQGFLRQWTKEGERADEVKRIVIELPLDWLKSGLELVDTPGVNNEFTRHHGYTEQEAEGADVALLLMDARQGGGKRTEFAFMNDVQGRVARSFVVANKMDRIDADERAEMTEYLEEEALPAHWNGPVRPPVVGVSALASLRGDADEDLQSAFDELVRRVETVAREERGKILLHRLGEPEKKLFEEAKQLEAAGKHDRAHRLYFDLLDVLEAAGLDTRPAAKGIARCEEQLTEQVASLDKLHAQVNEALERAETNPDGALGDLKRIRAQMRDLDVEDDDVDGAIRRLLERIKTREAARERTKELLAMARVGRKENELIDAAHVAQSITDHLDTAELADERRAEIEAFVEARIQDRDEWADRQWHRLSDEARAHLDEHEYQAAAGLLDNLERVQPFLDIEHGAERLLATIREKHEAHERYEEQSAALVDEARSLLAQDRVPVDEAQSLRERLGTLAVQYDKLHGADGLPDLPTVNDDAPCLTIDEKLAMAVFLHHVAQASDKTSETTALVRKIEERQVTIRRTHIHRAGDKSSLEKVKRYPDHPAALRLAQSLMSETPSAWYSDKISHQIDLMVEFRSFLNTNSGFLDRIEGLNRLYHRSLKRRKYAISLAAYVTTLFVLSLITEFNLPQLLFTVTFFFMLSCAVIGGRKLEITTEGIIEKAKNKPIGSALSQAWKIADAYDRSRAFVDIAATAKQNGISSSDRIFGYAKHSSKQVDGRLRKKILSIAMRKVKVGDRADLAVNDLWQDKQIREIERLSRNGHSSLAENLILLAENGQYEIARDVALDSFTGRDLKKTLMRIAMEEFLAHENPLLFAKSTAEHVSDWSTDDVLDELEAYYYNQLQSRHAKKVRRLRKEAAD